MPVTTVGTEVENFIEHQLERNGYNVETQVACSGINQEWSRIDIVLLGEKYEAISSSIKTFQALLKKDSVKQRTCPSCAMPTTMDEEQLSYVAVAGLL